MKKRFSKDNLDHFVAMTDLFRQSLNGSREIPLDSTRVDAMKRFAELGFPTTKHEDWKYTNLAGVRRLDARPVLEVDPASVDTESVRNAGYHGEGWHLRFVNGHFVESASDLDGLPSGVVVTSLKEAINRYTDIVTEHIARYPEEFEHSFALLNTAHLRDGAYVFVPRGTRVEKPIHVHYHTVATDGPVATFPRSLFLFEDDTEGTVVEEFTLRRSPVRSFCSKTIPKELSLRNSRGWMTRRI
jgi:Fe-S cluster assembly protein SufD